jgi:hypothetical protein
LLGTFVGPKDIWALGRGGDYLLELPVYRAVQWIGVRIGDEVSQGCCMNLSDLRCSRLDPEHDGHEDTPVARFHPRFLTNFHKAPHVSSIDTH